MKTCRRLTNIFILFSFFAVPLISKAQNAITDTIYTLPTGTRINVKMDNEINSKVSSVNDTFTATVSSPVIIRNVAVLPVGSIIEGRIVKVNRAALGRKNGSFEVKFETLNLAGNVKRQIDGSLVNLPDTDKNSPLFNPVAIIGGTAVGAVFGTFAGKGSGALIGAGIGAGAGTVAVLLRKGKEARIKANEVFAIRLNKEVTLPVEDF